MLMPLELDGYAQVIAGLYEGLEEYILKDVARRLDGAVRNVVERGAKTAGTADFGVNALRDMGMSMAEIQSRVALARNQTVHEVEQMFIDANIRSFERERRMAQMQRSADIRLSADKMQFIRAAAQRVNQNLLSVTGSLGLLGMPLEGAYQSILDTALLKVQSGAVDYNSAIRQAVNALSERGLERINWRTGHRDNLDVAVRRAIRTSLSQITNRISELNADEMEADGWEISAHTGARPTHQEWQGRQFARYRHAAQGFPLYDDVVQDMMNDFNCRHSKWGIFLGQKPLLSPEEVENIDPPPFEFNGRTYNAYQATQMQRKIEREIRKTKREIIMLEQTGNKTQLAISKSRLKDRNALYRTFSEAAGLPLQPERKRVLKPHLHSKASQGIMGTGDRMNLSGAISRHDIKRMDAHADRYYEAIRKRKSDVEAISGNTGFTPDEVDSIKKHIFIETHERDTGEWERFDPDYDMAVSWQRLAEGKDIHEMDIVLLYHELTELELMKQGLSYDEAHALAEIKYNYKKYVDELDAKEGIF